MSYTDNPTQLYAKGKITRKQMTRMIKQEIRIMQLAHEVRMERVKKTHTCK